MNGDHSLRVRSAIRHSIGNCQSAISNQQCSFGEVRVHVNPSDDVLRKLLSDAATIAMVGASSDPEKPSHGIMRKLQHAGYRVIPVNPKETEVLGERAYGSLEEVPDAVDIVDVFRRSEDTPPLADAAVKVGAKALWLQQGISNEQAATRAEANGLLVVMNACIGVTHTLLKIPKKTTTA
jgi:uncharacterized protein